MKIGYFIPEFPGQTHIMMWRERTALMRFGITVELVSTRLPSDHTAQHTWAKDAQHQTTYLSPLGFDGAVQAAIQVLRCGPRACWRALRRACTLKTPTFTERLRTIALLAPAARLASVCRHLNLRHVHVHSCHRAAMVALLARDLGGAPYSLTLHSPISMYGPAQSSKWGNAKFGIVVTERLRREVLKVAPEIFDRVDVAPMGVDLSVFHRNTPFIPPQFGEPVRLVSCGRLHVKKGHQDVIRAVGELGKRGINAQLTVLGEGPARPMLEALIQELGLRDHVILVGAVAEEDVRDSLATSHIFILGSHDEAIGVATMEAMAMALPVVVTDVGGVSELVRNEVDGIMTPANQPDSIASAVEWLIGNPARAQTMGASGQSRVRELFASDRSARVIARRLGAQGHESQSMSTNPLESVA